MKITDLDKTFISENISGKNDIVFLDAKEKPFDLYGVFFDGTQYRRLSKENASLVSEATQSLSVNTSGGRIRFKTDSPYVAIKCKESELELGKMTSLAYAGFDANINEGEISYIKPFMTPFNYKGGGYETIIDFGVSKMREITINFPMYHDVEELYIGLAKESRIDNGKKYEYDNPIVFYGSSITQGCAACRPSNAYTNIVSNDLNVDILNLGFSGSAKGEDKMAEYISKLNMFALVLDYDHNAPNVEHLRSTHANFFNIIRKANRELPIIIVSKPMFRINSRDRERKEVILETYNEAIKNGDENVYFVDGEAIFNDYDRQLCTIDGTHPNDVGMLIIARNIEKCLKDIMRRKHDR